MKFAASISRPRPVSKATSAAVGYNRRMSSPARQLEPTNEPLRMTAAEYLKFEEASEVRHEFHAGIVICMPGGTYEHSRITINTTGVVTNALDGSTCFALNGDMKVAIEAADRYVYPDGMIVCGEPVFANEGADRTIITNPSVFIEVLSPSSEVRDRGEKFRAYRKLASFREYVLISQSAPLVETFLRNEDGSWRILSWSGLDEVVELGSVGIKLPMSQIYRGVTFPDPPVEEAEEADEMQKHPPTS